MTDQKRDQQTDRQTDIRVHREVSLQIIEKRHTPTGLGSKGRGRI